MTASDVSRTWSFVFLPCIPFWFIFPFMFGATTCFARPPVRHHFDFFSLFCLICSFIPITTRCHSTLGLSRTFAFQASLPPLNLVFLLRSIVHSNCSQVLCLLSVCFFLLFVLLAFTLALVHPVLTNKFFRLHLLFSDRLDQLLLHTS